MMEIRLRVIAYIADIRQYKSTVACVAGNVWAVERENR